MGAVLQLMGSGSVVAQVLPLEPSREAMCRYRLERLLCRLWALLLEQKKLRTSPGFPKRPSPPQAYQNVSKLPLRYKTEAYLLTSSSSSCKVSLFFSFVGFGFLTLGGAAVSSLLNQSDSSGRFAKSSMSSCCIARAAIIAFAFLTSPDGFSGSACDPHQVSNCFIRRGSGRLCSMYL
jgi:hypothetical protein